MEGLVSEQEVERCRVPYQVWGRRITVGERDLWAGSAAGDELVVGSCFGRTKFPFQARESYIAVNLRTGKMLGRLPMSAQKELLPTYGADVFFLGRIASLEEVTYRLVLESVKAIGRQGGLFHVEVRDKDPVGEGLRYYVGCPMCGKMTLVDKGSAVCPECGQAFHVEGARWQQARTYVPDVWTTGEGETKVFRAYALLRTRIDTLSHEDTAPGSSRRDELLLW